MVVKVGFVKLGSIGSALLIEFLLDERAERQDLDVTAIGAGAKISVDQAAATTTKILDFKPDFVVITTPNAALPGPTKAREILGTAGVLTITVSDSPAKKAVKAIEEAGQGYIVVEADSMLGARREFLDPIEMALFNADLAKVLSITGGYNILCDELDKVIDSIKKGEKPTLPRLIVDKEKATNAGRFKNPYAKAKAMAAYETARRVSDLTVEACFVQKEWEKYTSLAAAAHEMLRQASKLADEARELEKAGDTVHRAPHYDDGTVLEKTALIEKPAKPDWT